MKQFSRAAFFRQLNSRPSSAESLPVAPPQLSNQASLQSYTGPWGRAEVLHLVRRALFGAKKEDIDFFCRLSLSQSLDVLLKPSPLPSPPVNAYNDAAYTDPDIKFGETWVRSEDFGNKGGVDQKRQASLKAWWVGLILNQDRSLTEGMTLFWHNRVPCSFEGTFDARSFYTYLVVVQKHSMGSFKKMVLEVTTCAGMLQYLSGNSNTAEAPNENYSRELQELFTVGTDPDSHYTQQDVTEAARLLTGWVQNPEIGFKVSFNPSLHDSGDKHFSSFYNNTAIKGQSGIEGKNEIGALIDMIFEQREVARHICRNLYRWFVANTIDADIENNIIHPLADIFAANDYEIVPVLRALLGSQHFFDEQNRGTQIKNPVDFLLGYCRQFNASIHPTDLADRYNAWYALSIQLGNLNMCPGEPPNVAGWQPSYLAPAYDQLWINSKTLPARNAASDSLIAEGNAPQGEGHSAIYFDVLRFTHELADPGNVDSLMAESLQLLSAVPFDVTQTSFLKSMLLSEEEKQYLQYLQELKRDDAQIKVYYPDIPAADDSTRMIPPSFRPASLYAAMRTKQVFSDFWCETWNSYRADPDNPSKKNEVLKRLTPYYIYILQRGECQLM